MDKIAVGQKGRRSIKLTAEVQVLSVHATKPVTQLKVLIRRENGEAVLEGEAWCYTFEPEARHER